MALVESGRNSSVAVVIGRFRSSTPPWTKRRWYWSVPLANSVWYQNSSDGEVRNRYRWSRSTWSCERTMSGAVPSRALTFNRSCQAYDRFAIASPWASARQVASKEPRTPSPGASFASVGGSGEVVGTGAGVTVSEGVGGEANVPQPARTRVNATATVLQSIPGILSSLPPPKTAGGRG